MRLLLCSGALGIAAVLVGRPGPATADEGSTIARLERRVADLEKENAALRSKCQWLERLRRHDPARKSGGVARVRLAANGSGSPLAADGEHEKQLRAIRLAEPASKDDVREYVAQILAVSVSRDLFSVYDPEIEMLKRVGSANVDVLVEPLIYLEGPESSPYLTEAIKAVVVEAQKAMLLESLAAAPSLVEVIVARGWTRDAAPTLLKGLAAQSPYLDAGWIAAAASVARPEDYASLRFQLAHGLNPWSTWLAIRDLPSMEPLDAFIDQEWRRTTWKKGSWQWASFAAVAAHYGHLDALGVLAERGAQSGTFQGAFESLTGYEGVPEEGRAWFEKNRDRLVFDRAKRVYARSSGGR